MSAFNIKNLVLFRTNKQDFFELDKEKRMLHIYGVGNFTVSVGTLKYCESSFSQNETKYFWLYYDSEKSEPEECMGWGNEDLPFSYFNQRHDWYLNSELFYPSWTGVPTLYYGRYVDIPRIFFNLKGIEYSAFFYPAHKLGRNNQLGFLWVIRRVSPSTYSTTPICSGFRTVYHDFFELVVNNEKNYTANTLDITDLIMESGNVASSPTMESSFDRCLNKAGFRMTKYFKKNIFS